MERQEERVLAAVGERGLEAQLHDVQVVRHHGEGRADLVRDARDERAQRRHLLRRGQVLARLLERLARAAALREVAHVHGVAAHAPVVVQEAREHGAHEEARAVLARAPGLLLEAAFARRRRERFGRRRAATIGRVRESERLPEDLARVVAVEPLCADVPRRDAAFDVEVVDGVVVHALDEETISFFVLVSEPEEARVVERQRRAAGQLLEEHDVVGRVAARAGVRDDEDAQRALAAHEREHHL